VRRARGLITLAIALAVAAAAVAATEQRRARPARAQTLTVYSSLPLQAASRPQTTALVRGIRMALAEAHGRAGRFAIRYRSLDDSTASADSWTPAAESMNARRAAMKRRSIAYIGAFNSGATVISMPILNQARILQVSPSNTYVGLTRSEPGSFRGEPEKYHPSGRLNYVRIVPRDTVQAAALALLMKRRGCRRVFVLHDGEAYGRGMAVSVRRYARRRGLRVVGFRYAKPSNPRYVRLARRIRRERAGCVAYGGITANNAVQIFKNVARGVPRAKLFAGDGVAESAFADPREGGLPAGVARRVRVTVAILAPDAYPRRGRRFFARFARRYGDRSPDPYAIYGYESMRLVLASIRRAGANGDRRRAVIRAAFATRRRRSVLGRYSIDRHGDTTLTDYGVYRIIRGELWWDRRVRP
jgi:branched-chain amino acid transport system substrate-binding protein